MIACVQGACDRNNPNVLVHLPYFPAGVALDATNAYWTYNEEVGTCALAGCSDQPTWLANRTGKSPALVTVDDTNVYWTETTGAVMRVAK